MQLKVDCTEIDASDMGWLDQVLAVHPEKVFIALHGPFGEDGSVQRILENHNIRFTGSDSSVSAVAINKARTKQILTGVGIPVPYSKLLTEAEECVYDRVFPAVVKPNGDGSSFGVSIVNDQEGMHPAVTKAFKYSQEVLIEEFISGIEVSCGVTAISGVPAALPVIEVRPRAPFFDFESKYEKGGSEELCPAPIDKNLNRLIQEYSVLAFKTLNCRQYARADFIIRNRTPYFLEINTLPGMTVNSLLPKELAVAGIRYQDFIKYLLKV